jgi:hypothetical protein
VLLEGREHVLPAPGVVADRSRPAVVVARLAAHVDHPVDARTATERLAARVSQSATVEPGVGFGLVEPVGSRIADAVQVADWDVDPVIVVAPTGLDQQHVVAGIGRQPIGHQRPGRAGADHDVVDVHFDVGITNSAPFGVLSGQRCMIDFCRV